MDLRQTCEIRSCIYLKESLAFGSLLSENNSSVTFHLIPSDTFVENLSSAIGAIVSRDKLLLGCSTLLSVLTAANSILFPNVAFWRLHKIFQHLSRLDFLVFSTIENEKSKQMVLIVSTALLFLSIFFSYLSLFCKETFLCTSLMKLEGKEKILLKKSKTFHPFPSS